MCVLVSLTATIFISVMVAKKNMCRCHGSGFTFFLFVFTLTNVCNFVSLPLFFAFEIFVVQKWFCVCDQLFRHLAARVSLVSPVSYFNRDVFIKESFATSRFVEKESVSPADVID